MTEKGGEPETRMMEIAAHNPNFAVERDGGRARSIAAFVEKRPPRFAGR